MDEFGASPLAPRVKKADAREIDRKIKPGALQFDDVGDVDDMAGVLYGDLVESSDKPAPSGSIHGATLLKLKAAKLESELAAAEETSKALMEEVGMLREANVELVEKNRSLEYNISSLFNTAKLEIERKDAEIQRLRKELQGRGHDRRSRSHGGEYRGGQHRSHSGGRR